jgi:hypothetical protein
VGAGALAVREHLGVGTAGGLEGVGEPRASSAITPPFQAAPASWPHSRLTVAPSAGSVMNAFAVGW